MAAAVFFAEQGSTRIRRALTGTAPATAPAAGRRPWLTPVPLTSGPRLTRTRANGKLERFNGTLAREWASAPEYESEQDRRDALTGFLNHYRPPASRVLAATYRPAASRIIGIYPAAWPRPSASLRHEELAVPELDADCGPRWKSIGHGILLGFDQVDAVKVIADDGGVDMHGLPPVFSLLLLCCCCCLILASTITMSPGM